MALPSDLIDAISGPDAAGALRALDAEGRLTTWFPELEDGRGFVQPEKHHYTVLDHNFAAVSAVDTALGPGPASEELRGVLSWMDFEAPLERKVGALPLIPLLRLSALLHDVAKPATAAIVDGATRFPRHGPRGAEMMRERLPALGFDEEATDFVARMLRYHLRPGELVRNWPPTDRAIRKFVTDLDGHVLPLMLINLADGMATRGPGYTRQNFRMHCGFVNYVVARAWAISNEAEAPLITGEDLILELDLASGRLLGAVLTSVRRAQAVGTVSDRAQALALARELLVSLRTEDA